jgi:hypothetical protein
LVGLTDLPGAYESPHCRQYADFPDHLEWKALPWSSQALKVILIASLATMLCLILGAIILSCFAEADVFELFL